MTDGFLQHIPASLRSSVALVLTDEGKPTSRLKNLITLHKLPFDGSFRDAVITTQRAWRKAAKVGELAANADDSFSPDVLRRTFSLLDSLGQSGNSGIELSLPYYDWAAVHEHFPLEAFRRLETLAAAWQQRGARFGRIAVLGCAIPLEREKNIEYLAAIGALPLGNLPHQMEFPPVTTLAAIGCLLRYGPFPEEMRRLPIDLISSPFRRAPTDTHYEYSVWPDTGDSIDTWWDCGQHYDGDEDLPDYLHAPARWYWPVEGALPNILAATNGWQSERQKILTWTELVKRDKRFRQSTIETLSGKPGYSYSASLRLREFAAFLWTISNCLLKPYLGWDG